MRVTLEKWERPLWIEARPTGCVYLIGCNKEYVFHIEKFIIDVECEILYTILIITKKNREGMSIRMNKYIALLRGVNISGKNKLSMSELKASFLARGYKEVLSWSFDRTQYARCNWWKKTASSGIGEFLTIRTAHTLRKIATM